MSEALGVYSASGRKSLCEFIALATNLDSKLFTMAKKLLREFPKYAYSITVGQGNAD